MHRLASFGSPRIRAEARLVLGLLGEREIDTSVLERPDADLLDEWETECLVGAATPVQRLERLGPRGATALQGRIALMAGEALLLVSPENAVPLLLRAQDPLAANGFWVASERAAEMANLQTEPESAPSAVTAAPEKPVTPLRRMAWLLADIPASNSCWRCWVSW